MDGKRLARVGDFDYRTARICDFLLPGPRGPRAWVNSLVNEIGNADTPPMFKSFLTLSVEDNELVITCHGVTGWQEQASNVPTEDRVRIRLHVSARRRPSRRRTAEGEAAAPEPGDESSP